MNALLKPISAILFASSVGLLASCAATQTALEHGSLQVSTKQKGDSIFLEPVSAKQKNHLRGG